MQDLDNQSLAADQTMRNTLSNRTGQQKNRAVMKYL